MSLNDQLLHAQEHPSLGRRMRGWLVIAVLCTLTAVGFRALRTPPPNPAFAVGAPSRSAVAPGVRSTVELEARLISDLPLAYVRMPDSIARAGPSDRAKAIRDDGAAGAAAALDRAHFVRGYQRAWGTRSRDVVAAIVYQFGSAAGARTYAARVVRLLPRARAGGRAVRVRTVSGAVVATGSEGGKTVAEVIRTSGDFVVDIQCAAPTTAVARSLAFRLAGDQVARLAG